MRSKVIRSIIPMFVLQIIGLGLGGSVVLASPTMQQSESGDAQTVKFGGKYDELNPRQREMVDTWFYEYSRIMGQEQDPKEGYNQVPLSARTTFEAVTHALMMTQLTDEHGNPMGTALDLVKLVESVSGRIPDVRGDLQFRIYALLQPGAVDQLEKSREFSRHHDNTHYHRDYPLNYRQDGTPSIQFSISRRLERADIDVDYRSSSFPKVLFDGHLTAGNSDVRAGSNFQTHVGRWEGFVNWWRHLFGLPILVENDPQTFSSEYKIPPIPNVTASENLEEAVYDFLHSWLVEQQPTHVLAYFAPSSYDCVLAFHGKPIDTEMARFQILHELQLTNRMLGKVENLEQVVRPVYSRMHLTVKPHAHSDLFSYYSLPPEVLDYYTCPPPEGYREVKLSARGDEHFGTYLQIMGPHGESQEMKLIWTEESGYWKIRSIFLGPDTHHSDIPDARPDSGLVSKSPAHPTGNPELEAAAADFYTLWFLRRDYSAASKYMERHCHDCTNIYLENGEDPHETPEEATAHLLEALQAIAEALPAGNRLEAMLEASQPWHEEVLVIDHPHKAAYTLASVPDSVAKPLMCEHRTKHKTIHPGLPPHEGDVYLSSFHPRTGQLHPPILFLLWAKVEGNWKVVSYHVETD